MVVLLAATAGAGPLSTKSTDDDVLDAMHDRGSTLKSFKADVTQKQVDSLANEVTYKGHVAFESLAGGDARLHFLIDTKKKGKGPERKVPPREYLLANGWLTDRDYSLQNETRRQVVRPGQKIDLFSLGKGPFPLPIGQDRAQVRRLFDVSRPPADKDDPDPPHTIHLQLTPKDGTDLARRFTTIDFWVDTDQQMPVRIETHAPNGDDQTTDLLNLKLNTPVSDGDFTPEPLKGKWNTHEEPIQ
jgi:outer membrane lipoprotein-sorting protein